MFTQCPDCQTTFRVSAEVLEQADGRVRCGGCGNAFNAIDYLSEDDASQAVPDDRSSTEPTSEENEKLLETLDKLAGPEVSLEDTGTEWRVLEVPDEEDAEEQAAESTAVHGRESDLPQPVPDEQDSLDLHETDLQQAKASERRYDDNTVLPDNFGEEDDVDEIPFLKAETPKRRASDREIAQDNAEFADTQVDLALGEPDEWMDLLTEVGDEEADANITAEASAEEEPAAVEEEPAAVEEVPAEAEKKPAEAEIVIADDEPPGEEMPSDINTQFLLQAEEMGLDTGGYPVLEIDENEYGDEPAAEEEKTEATDFDEMDVVELDAEVEDDKEEAGEESDQFEMSLEEIEALAELDIEEELTPSDNEDEVATEATEEADDEIASADEGGKKVDKPFDEESPMVEAIVLEGELVGDSINQKRMIDTAAAGKLEGLGKLQDTYSLNRGTAGDSQVAKLASSAVIPSIVILALLLIGQVLHQSRQSLATYDVFNDTIGAIYRVLGEPVTPEWDIRGWRFEATNGNVDEEEDLLTIYSRIANKSSQALPYPLLHISLTDRWEDVIGSRALEPNEYLAGDLDPSKPIPSGENFTAVITIESPSADATGFRLTACYRISPGRVRCADEHFKN